MIYVYKYYRAYIFLGLNFLALCYTDKFWSFSLTNLKGDIIFWDSSLKKPIIPGFGRGEIVIIYPNPGKSAGNQWKSAGFLDFFLLKKFLGTGESGWAWYSQGEIRWRGQYWGDQTWNNAGWAARGKQVQLNTWNFVALCLWTPSAQIPRNFVDSFFLLHLFKCPLFNGRYLHFRILKFPLNYFLIPKPKKHAHVLMFCPSTSQLPAVQRDLWRDGAQQLWLIGGLGLLA